MAVTVINPNRQIAEALKAIKKVEPDLIKKMQKDIRKEAKPTTDSIKAYLKWLDPDITPFNSNGPSGIERGVLIKSRGDATKWSRQLVLRGIRVKFGGPTRKARMGKKAYAVMTIIQGNAAGAIFDVAGSRNLGKPGNKFVENLRKEDKPHKTGERSGRTGPSRYMWPGAEDHLPQLRAASTEIMDNVVRQFNRKYGR